jgi:hypothetical protein
MKTGRAALDPSNPMHHHSLSLPGAFYMEGKPTRLKFSKEEQARLDKAREEYQRELATGKFPRRIQI